MGICGLSTTEEHRSPQREERLGNNRSLTGPGRVDPKSRALSKLLAKGRCGEPKWSVLIPPGQEGQRLLAPG